MQAIVYVVIVTFNPKKWVNLCFNSLKNSSIPLKCIVIDNASTDGSVAIIKEQYPEVDLIESKENLGFGKANNIGIKKAYENGADYIFLLNQDAWIDNNSIELLINAADKNPDYGIVSPIHLNGKGDAIDYNFSKYIVPPKCINLYSDIYLNRTNESLYDVNFINAAAWLLSRKCIETVGGFSPSFFHYGEDDNYCERVLFHKLKIGVFPQTKIYHDRLQGQNSNFFTDKKLSLKRYFVYKFSNPFSKRTKISFYKSAFKDLYIALVCLNFKEIKNKIEAISVLNSIDFNELSKNKDVSKKAGTSFLQF